MHNLAVEKKYKDVVKRHRELLAEWMTNHSMNEGKTNLHYIPE
jgi:hypothetical protein